MKNKILFLVIISTSFNLLFAQTDWSLLNPTPSVETGRKVQFTSPDIGYILNNKKILETIDAGETWTVKQNINSGIDMSIKYGVGYIVGSGGYILKSNDNGENWQQITIGTSNSLNSINIIDNETVIVSSINQIFKSVDGGENWTSYDVPYEDIKKVTFTSALVGHAACKNGKILKTIDGGENWTITYSINVMPNDFYSIYFYDENTGYASRQHSTLLKTTDGGDTWFEISSPSLVYSIHFIDKNRGYITGDHGAIYRTLNGGNYWNPVPFQNGYISNTTMYGIYFEDLNTGYAVGSRGRIIKTTNAGLDWEQYSPTYNDINKMQIIDDEIIYAQTGPHFFKTNDFGNNWSFVGTIELGVSASVSAYKFVNENIGYATDSDGYVFKTIDGGETWEKTNNGLRVTIGYIRSIDFIDENTGVISGGSGYIDEISRTTDGGNTWTTVINFEIFNKIQFINSQIGYAFKPNKVFKTIDSGITWEEIFTNTSADIRSFHFVNGNLGYLVGHNSLIYRTIDGGENWVQLYIPNDSYKLIKFRSIDEGYVLNNNGEMLKTEDGGTHWVKYHNLLPITFIEFKDDFVFIGGPNGRIYKNKDIAPDLNTIDLQKVDLFTIYPNPTSDYLNILLHESNELDSIELFDSNGRIFQPSYNQISNKNLKLDITHFPTGVYFLKANFKNKKSVAKRFIIK